MKRSLTVLGLGLAALTFAVWWGWFRFYVPPGYMAVLTSKEGKPLPPGQILAGPGQQGIREDVLGGFFGTVRSQSLKEGDTVPQGTEIVLQVV